MLCALPCAAALALALGLLAASAAALPRVTFKVVPLPLPGFRHTGYILGSGAALRAEYTVSGVEYLGAPPPIIGVHFYLPAGTTLHPAGFPTCGRAALEKQGPSACPRGSAAGPIGRVTGFVNFGHEPVVETAELSSFYAPGGGLEFFTDGHTPVSLEILSSGHYENLHGAGGYGPELVTEVPLVPSVPGAPYASVSSINVEAGSAFTSHGKAVYYGTSPKVCPKNGFPVKTEVIFDENGATPPVPETVTIAYRAPCPRR